MPAQRVSCPRHHLLFQIVEQGLEIKCRAGECKQVYLLTWAELDAKRQEVLGYSPLLDRTPNLNLDIVIHKL